MKHNLKRWIAVVLAIALLSGLTIFISAGTSVSKLGSLLDSYAEANGETYTLKTSSRLFVVASSAPTGELLQTVQLIQRELAAAKYPSSAVLEMVWGPEDYARTGDIVLKVDSSAGLGTEGYSLNVGDTATVTGNDVDGLLYGANMLMKCFGYANGTSIIGFTAKDAPDTKQRVVMLDTGRKYYTVEWICNFIRQMSWMGYNALEFHFSEDGGFRADFWDSKYYTDTFTPENGNDFTWLCGSHVQSWVKDPYRDDPDANKYLTTAELVQICEVAKEYHIDIIPSFDSPAHMDYITWKFEQNYKSNTGYSFTYNGTTYKASSTKGCINYRGTTGASSPTWPYYTTIDITNATMAKAFVFALYEDIAEFFKEYAGSTYFAIGADEVNLSSSSCKWDYSDFPGYINDLNSLLKSKGYTMRMFNDFMGSTSYNYSAYNSTSNKYVFDSDIEIMYWTSPLNPNSGNYNEGDGNYTVTASVLASEGYTLYNCVQTNCYYVLRVAASTTDYPNMDARNPENYNWTFYHSTEEDIYNEWKPTDFGEKGNYKESDVISESKVGGAYFLIWNDYAALNTETEIWNDVKDNTGTSSYVYSLFDRMWSNIIKMWNWDINDSVTYANFKTVRNTFGNFPGFTSCSADAYLPAATSAVRAYKADHGALTAALNNVITSQGNYTDESWNAYQSAITTAQAVNSDYGATEEQLTNAITGINNAKNALTEKVVVAVDITKLQIAVDNAFTEQGSIAEDSWTTYQTALNAAKAALDAASSQDAVDEALADLLAAESNLTVTDSTAEFITIRKISKTTPCGKKVGLVITTSVSGQALTLNLNGEPVLLTLRESNVQTLDGQEVRVWMVNFPAEEIGAFDYTMTLNGTVSQNVPVIVK